KQFGKPLPFESVQLAQFDNISVSTINETSVTTWSVPDRVRGYRQFITANQLFFNTEEIRFPLLPSLRTSILDLIYFGITTIAIFSDVASADDMTFPASNKSLVQWGLGGDIKNKLNILGLPLTHALGMANPHNAVFDNKIKPELYY